METNLMPDAMMTLTNVGLGYFYSAALRAVAELGIADLLADGPRSSRVFSTETPSMEIACNCKCCESLSAPHEALVQQSQAPETLHRALLVPAAR